MAGVLKRPTKKALPSNAKKAVPIKSSAQAGRGTTPKKAALPKKTTKPATKSTVERNEWGITVGTDQAIILDEMIKGGADKHEVIERCNKIFEGQTTSGGKPKPISTVVNQLIHTMAVKGFVVESTWKIVPPADGVLKEAPARRSPAKPAKKVVRPPVKKTVTPKVTKGGKLPVRKAIKEKAAA